MSKINSVEIFKLAVNFYLRFSFDFIILKYNKETRKLFQEAVKDELVNIGNSGYVVSMTDRQILNTVF